MLKRDVNSAVKALLSDDCEGEGRDLSKIFIFEITSNRNKWLKVSSLDSHFSDQAA